MAKVNQIKSEYRLPNPLVYRLSNPNYTIYHRAALGGLAATVHAWGKSQPAGITAKIEADSVSLAWDSKLSDKDFLRILLDNSFRLRKDKLIDLPGQQIDSDKDDLRIAVHSGFMAVFLQHNQMRTAEKEIRRISLKLSVDDETERIFSYKGLDNYAHQRAKSLGPKVGSSRLSLIDEKLEELPSVAVLSQWIIPGVTSGASELESPIEEAILLIFLAVGSVVFQLDSQMPKVRRENRQKKKGQMCLIVPDVVNLARFSRAVGRINSQKQNPDSFTNTYLNRVVSGAEEAALRFLIDLQTDDLLEAEPSIDGCIAIAMGKVAWDPQQINRSIIARVRGDYAEIGVFKAAQVLGKAKILKTKDGNDFILPSSPIPELVAANLTAERHWAFGFKTLVSEKKDFERMFYSRGGLQKMKEAINDPNDGLIVNVFHDAWNNIMGDFGERAKSGEFIFKVKVENEQEKMRNAILRAKTSDALASWFLRFCAEASRKAPVKTLQKNGEQVRKFIFSNRNFERFQNLCLFALVSYAAKEKTENQTEIQGESK